MNRLHAFPFLILVILLAACSAPAATVEPSPLPENTATQPAPTLTLAPTASAVPTTAPTTAETVEVSVPEALGTAGERTIGDPYTPELGNTGYDVQRYTLTLALDPAEVYLTAQATIEAAATLADLGQISLDFIGFEIEQITLDGSPVDYSREEEKLVVGFPQPMEEGQVFTLIVNYSGSPVQQPSRYVPFVDHLGLQFQPGQNTLFAVNEPDGARYWFPCNDHPRDKAAFRFELTVPEGLTGVANGLLVDSQTEVLNAFPDGRPGDRYIWEHEGPMATYLATVAVGEYVRVEGSAPEGVPLRSYVFPAQQDAIESAAPLFGEMMAWMSERLGPYPFEAFGYVTISGLGASLETQTMVILEADPRSGTTAHELFHQWFGNWVSLDSWASIWRNEGFATYMTALWEYRDDPQGLENTVAAWDAAMQSRPARLESPPPAQMFAGPSYYGGALLAHALHEELGDEAFYAGLRLYFDRYGGSTASQEEFQAALEEASGQDLDLFFEEWLGE